jgi:hypothetical protein
MKRIGITITAGLLPCFVALCSRAAPFDHALTNFWFSGRATVPAGGQVNAIVEANGVVYLGGVFNYLGPRTGGGAVLNAATGVLDPAWPQTTVRTPPPSNLLKAIDVHAVVPDGAGGWFIGGQFYEVNGVQRKGVAHVLGDKTLDTNWNANLGGNAPYVYALALAGTNVYLGGTFTSAGGFTRNLLAAVDSVTGAVRAWDAMLSSPLLSARSVRAIAVSPTTVYVGGRFTNAGPAVRNNLCALDINTGMATAWNPEIVNPLGEPLALLLSGNSLYVGGFFESVGGVSRNNLAALDAVTGQATSWNPSTEFNGTVNALAVSGSRV